MFFFFAARGSRVKVKCTKQNNTVCECRPGFVPFSKESSICICEKGSGLKDNGKVMIYLFFLLIKVKDETSINVYNFLVTECLKCQDGYFSSSYDTSCQKWKEYDLFFPSVLII